MPNAVWMIGLHLCVNPVMEAERAAGTQKQLLGAGFCHPRACPDTQTAIGLQPAALASHNTAGPQLGLVVVGVHRAGGCSPPTPTPLPIPSPEQTSLLGELPFPQLPLRFSWPWLMLFLLP